jgi:hypothetical protein
MSETTFHTHTERQDNINMDFEKADCEDGNIVVLYRVLWQAFGGTETSASVGQSSREMPQF